MALDQRQHAFADRAEADHHQRSVDPAVNGPVRHLSRLVSGNRVRDFAGVQCGKPRRGSTRAGRRARRLLALAGSQCRNILHPDDTGRLLFIRRKPDHMNIPFAAVLVLALLLPLGAGAASAQGSLRSGNAVFDRAVEIVLANFYRAVGTRPVPRCGLAHRRELSRASRRPSRHSVDDAHRLRAPEPRDLAYRAAIAPGSVEYYELLDVFRFAARDAVRRLYPPEGNITYDGIGIRHAVDRRRDLRHRRL